MSITVTEFEGLTVGPDDFLVLITHERLSADQRSDLRRHLPDHLRPRVLVVESFEVGVVRASSDGVSA